MIGWLLARPWVRRLGLWLVAGGAFLAALATLRRSGERTGRLQQQLETERETSDARQRMLEPRVIVLAVATISLAACATARSDRVGTACVPVPAYGREFLSRAADEVQRLPEGSAVERMLEDYAVMRRQAQACR